MMGPDREHFSLHEEYDLIVVFYRRYLLGDRYERDPWIVRAYILEYLALRCNVEPCRKVVEQEYLRLESERSREHDSLLLSSGQAGSAFRHHRIEPIRESGYEVTKLRCIDSLFQALIIYRIAKCDVFPKRQIEYDAILEYESYLAVKRSLIQESDGISVIFDSTGCRLKQSGQEVEQLSLSSCSRTHDSRLRLRMHPKRDILEHPLLTEGKRYILDFYIAL